MHTRRKHGAALLAFDAARRSASGRWIAHNDRFPQVMFDLLTVGPNRVPDQAASHTPKVF